MGQRKYILPLTVAGVVILSLLEWHRNLDYSLGVFYTIPVLLAGTILQRREMLAFGIITAAARGLFTPANSDIEFFLKFVMASIAYCASGLLIVEMSNNRRRVLESYARLQLEQRLRHRAEEQLRTLSAASPAGILTIDAGCNVLAANRAAHDMLGYDDAALIGENVAEYFSIFHSALEMARRDQVVRTSTTGWARRRDRQPFPVQAWFSVQGDADHRTLAAIVVDMSEDVRERERENFQHLLEHNRLLAGAVSHEIRNLCSAASVVTANLATRPAIRELADFQALGQLVEGLSKLASFELIRRRDKRIPRADLRAVLEELRLVIDPDWDEIGGQVVCRAPDTVHPVAGDRHGLMQIFLNLAQNSCRAVRAWPAGRKLVITVVQDGLDTIVAFEDTGPGIANPDVLFHPFRKEADGSGMGLYISRELARSFGGDLRFIPGRRGCEFHVVLPVAVALA